MASLKGIIAACAATMLLAGCANSELNREVSRTFPIRQMDEFFGYRSPPAPPPARIYTPPDASSSGYGPVHSPSSGYAPAYPPYDPAAQNHL